ncbi:MAG: RidA family protein [Candidatus Binatia bacterium]
MSTKQVLSTSFWSRPGQFGPWSQGIRIPAGHDLLFTTGMTARDDHGNTVAPGDPKAQARRIFEQLKALLAEAGATLDDVAQMTVYVHDMDDVLAIQEVRNEYWPIAPPASATVQVARLVSPVVRLEVQAVAVIPKTND